jgi:hypothetical protein
MLVVVITMQVGPAHGAAGTCEGKFDVTLARRIISPVLGLTMDQMPVDHQWALSWFGLTM